MRRIWLCADDYALAPGVDAAIRELIVARRLNATSVMVPVPAFTAAEIAALKDAAKGTSAIIGLHVTLTAPFKPLTAGFAPLRDGKFLPTKDLLGAAIARRLDVGKFAAEVAAQLRAFIDGFGHPPDFIDGHQHCQLFPQIRDAVLRTAAEQAPNAWLRQGGGAGALPRRLLDRKALILEILSVRFRSKARRLGLRTNPAFAGTYSFQPGADFPRLFPQFLDGLPDGGLVMCHPGIVDDTLRAYDTLTDLREKELAYFRGDEFPRDLAAKGVALA